MKKLSSLLALSLLLCGLAIAQTSDHKAPANAAGQASAMSQPTRGEVERITHGPVVEATGNSWATIAWSTDTGGSSVVRYGTDKNQLTNTAEAPYADDKAGKGETHRVKIEHLKPGTTYYYMVDSGQGEGTGTEAKSGIEQFTTKR